MISTKITSVGKLLVFFGGYSKHLIGPDLFEYSITVYTVVARVSVNSVMFETLDAPSTHARLEWLPHPPAAAAAGLKHM